MVESKSLPMNKSDWSLIEKTVWENIKQYFPHVYSLDFIIAVSGGMDSMCLLYVFKELGISARVSHINYQKRGEAADKDALLVEKMAKKWGFEYHMLLADPTEAEDKNFQQWARNVRYNEFRHLKTKFGADGLALAHHEDDQVETILQKIFRGAGLPSWTAMEVWDGEIFRPLLDVSRSQIEAYVKEHDISYRTDESNLKPSFARNFLRKEWLPKLHDFFPGWKKNVLRISQQSDNYRQSLQWISEQITDDRGIDRKQFHSLEPGLQKALLLHILKQKDPAVQLSVGSLERIDELSDLQTGKTIELIPGISIIRDRDYYVLEFESDQTFESVKIKREELKKPLQIEELNFKITEFDNADFDNALYLDISKISWPLRVRRWKNGDKFQPLGMEGQKRVSDHLTDKKISAAYKEQALVVESFEETIYALIFPPIKNQISPGTISEQVKCDQDTNECLEIMYRR